MRVIFWGMGNTAKQRLGQIKRLSNFFEVVGFTDSNQEMQGKKLLWEGYKMISYHQTRKERVDYLWILSIDEQKFRNKIYCENIFELSKIIDFHILKNDEQININGIKYTFFDINPRDTKQFGFESVINGKRLMFLGDETLNPNLYERVKNADYVMHEAFCLDSEESIFHAYQKNHSTVKSVSKTMNELNVKNLILYHTEESHGIERKKLYIEEGKNNFNGNIYVPDELEVIEL